MSDKDKSEKKKETSESKPAENKKPSPPTGRVILEDISPKKRL